MNLWFGDEKMKKNGREGLGFIRFRLWENFGRVWLLVEVMEMKIVVYVYIGWENRVMFAQKRVMI